MTSDTIELSIEEIIDGPRQSPEVAMLQGLLKTVRVNRRAIEIIQALDAGDKKKAAEIALEAKKAGIDPNDLKAACRIQRKK